MTLGQYSTYSSILELKIAIQVDWNPITLERIHEHPLNGYRLSKKLAEIAAWDFVRNESPKFDITTINPPMVFGPVHPWIASLESFNLSNKVLTRLGLPHQAYRCITNANLSGSLT